MDRDMWNRLYWRCYRAVARMDRGRKTLRIKAAWLAWAERRTGKRCFFLPWD